MVFTNTKKIILYDLIKQFKKISQPELIKQMRKVVVYKDNHSARCAISKMINDLKNEGKIKITKIPTEGRGGIMTNIIHMVKWEMNFSNKIICPRCASNSFYVIDKRVINDVIRRRRKCKDCLHRITTHEVIVKRS